MKAKKNKKKFKLTRFKVLVISFLALIAVLLTALFIYIKPMLVTGKIVELEGTVTEVKSSYLMVKDDNNDIYKCHISSGTNFINDYKAKTGDSITVIYNYNEHLIESNEKKDEKSVDARRVYKNKVISQDSEEAPTE